MPWGKTQFLWTGSGCGVPWGFPNNWWLSGKTALFQDSMGLKRAGRRVIQFRYQPHKDRCMYERGGGERKGAEQEQYKEIVIRWTHICNSNATLLLIFWLFLLNSFFLPIKDWAFKNTTYTLKEPVSHTHTVDFQKSCNHFLHKISRTPCPLAHPQ